jgi:hypothetical protein
MVEGHPYRPAASSAGDQRRARRLLNSSFDGIPGVVCGDNKICTARFLSRLRVPWPGEAQAPVRCPGGGASRGRAEAGDLGLPSSWGRRMTIRAHRIGDLATLGQHTDRDGSARFSPHCPSLSVIMVDEEAAWSSDPSAGLAWFGHAVSVGACRGSERPGCPSSSVVPDWVRALCGYLSKFPAPAVLDNHA